MQVHAGRKPRLLRVVYSAQPGFALIMHAHDALLLAISKVPLPCGSLAVQPVLKQLCSAFAWDERMAAAHVLLPETIVEQCGDWYVTLCALQELAGLVAVGVSARIDTLPAHRAVAERWMQMPNLHL